MNTFNRAETKGAFAVWLTGLPASGKSTIASALAGLLALRGVDVAVLESDVWRKTLTPKATYSDEERDVFYAALGAIGRLLVGHGVPVVFDATANRRAYRDRARRDLARFLEVYVDSPLEVCAQRDPKGIYRRGVGDETSRVPGLHAAYEPPLNPELVVNGQDPAEESARRIIAVLEQRGYIPSGPDSPNHLGGGSTEG